MNDERQRSLLQKCKLQRDMLGFLEKSVEAGDVIQAATVVNTITETAGQIAYEAGRYNEALMLQADKQDVDRIQALEHRVAELEKNK